MPEPEDFQAQRADAIEMLEAAHQDQIEAWGKNAPRRDCHRAAQPMRDRATHGLSEERAIALLLPRP